VRDSVSNRRTVRLSRPSCCVTPQVHRQQCSRVLGTVRRADNVPSPTRNGFATGVAYR
jgi:hypothetical protein